MHRLEFRMLRISRKPLPPKPVYYVCFIWFPFV